MYVLYKGGNMRNVISMRNTKCVRSMKALQILTGVLIMIGGLMMHSSLSLAADPEFGVTVGMRSNNVDPTSTYANSFTASGKSGLNFGALALIPIKDQFGFRTAFTYSQRFLSLDPKAGGNSNDIKLAYLDIPLTLYYKFSDYAGIFAGPMMSLMQSKDCSVTGSTCALTNVQSTIMPISFGVTFKFAPQMGGELVYEQASGKLSDEIENLRSVGANFVFYFE